MLGGKDNDDYNHFNFPVEVALMVSVHLFSFLSYMYEKYLNEILFTVNHNSQFLNKKKNCTTLTYLLLVSSPSLSRPQVNPREKA